MRKQCAILTIKTLNYGGILQMFALYTFLLQNGYDCLVIDIFAKERKKPLLRSVLTFFYQKIFLLFFGDKCRKRRTKKFLESINFSCKISENKASSFSKKYKCDFLIVGSDQVWNDVMFNNSNVYFWPYEKDFTLLSYAASFGYSLDFYSPAEQHVEMLKKFDFISVREKNAEENLLKKYSIKANTVLDPTFLISKNEWIKVSNDSQIKPKHEYGFVYLMPGDEKLQSEMILFAEELSKKTGVTYYLVGLKDLYKFKKNKYKNALFGVGPNEWLYLLINSKWVVTNSFHGSVFSIIFSKDYYSFVNCSSSKNYPFRLLELIENFNQQEHLIDISNNSNKNMTNNKDNRINVEITIARSKEWLLGRLN